MYLEHIYPANPPSIHADTVMLHKCTRMYVTDTADEPSIWLGCPANGSPPSVRMHFIVGIKPISAIVNLAADGDKRANEKWCRDAI